jgi:hypothetical protein
LGVEDLFSLIGPDISSGLVGIDFFGVDLADYDSFWITIGP